MIYDLTSFREQDCPYQCPYCCRDMSDDEIDGHTEYNVLRIGHDIGGKATVFKCSECQEKSFIHTESLRWKLP
jgi:predicted RNA-binding Zn-ribbon protein involved in translation (DUF1610 family)